MQNMSAINIRFLCLRGVPLSGQRGMFCDLCTALPALEALDIQQTGVDNGALAELSGVACCRQGTNAASGKASDIHFAFHL